MCSQIFGFFFAEPTFLLIFPKNDGYLGKKSSSLSREQFLLEATEEHHYFSNIVMYLCVEAGSHRVGFFTEAWWVVFCLCYTIALLWNLKQNFYFLFLLTSSTGHGVCLVHSPRSWVKWNMLPWCLEASLPFKSHFSFSSLDVSAT